MKSMRRTGLWLRVIAVSLAAGCSSTGQVTQYETRSGVLAFESHGYPTQETVALVQDEVDYQRAVQAYIHWLPAVGIMQWRNGHYKLGGRAGDWTVYATTESKMPIITANDTTTYTVTFAELEDTDGLLVVEVPAGPTGGLVNDLWQRPVTDLGMTGPEQGEGATFLVVLAGTPVPKDHEADYVVVSETSTLLIGTRILSTDPEEAQRLLKAHKIHAYGEEPDNRIIEAPHSEWAGWQPRGLDYWRVVHQAIQLNSTNERDMFMMEGLKNLGIERGKPFAPSPEQAQILEEAALVGETWAMANSFSKRSPVKHWDEPNSQWQYILFLEEPLTQMKADYGEMDARSAYTYEAITIAKGNTMEIVDAGIQYLASYKDDAGLWLDGAKTYELIVPKDVPALNFWSVVLYDNDTRCMIDNAAGKAEINSRMDVVYNDDGSATLTFSPTEPASGEANWIQTNPDEGFFIYFRWYAPRQAFFDRSWVLGNITEVK
jgi:hypothetical protein